MEMLCLQPPYHNPAYDVMPYEERLVAVGKMIAHWIPAEGKWLEGTISHLNYRRRKWAEYEIRGATVEFSHQLRESDYGIHWHFIEEHGWHFIE